MPGVHQPGINPDHILFFGRKDNFWEMAEIGPCGPCSEIHLDRGIQNCDMQAVPGHLCQVNGDCQRFMELWNLVFIQYNRLSPTKLEPLPAKHVDTGMGFERIVSVLQGVDSNYRTDLLWPLILKTQSLTGHTDELREANFTPYRVIADHARAATFLIADGVIPGNLKRNYVTRMIIRRAYRFGGKIGLTQPFLAQVADVVINTYGDFYPELKQNRKSILISITREEEQFQRTLDRATTQLESLLDDAVKNSQKILPGIVVADLYTTYGMPFEITRDIALERGIDVNEDEFKISLDEHRQDSKDGNDNNDLDVENIEVYRQVFEKLVQQGALPENGVDYDPYGRMEVSGKVLALFTNGKPIQTAGLGDEIEIILPETCFYIKSGGQVSDTGWIRAFEKNWEIIIQEMRKPAAGVLVHVGKVLRGQPKVGDDAIASVDEQRRKDIMRNHTATHLLHAELHRVLGDHTRQAGSDVAPDRLRFDFTHPVAITPDQLTQIEAGINQRILCDYPLKITSKPLQEAISEGAMALFGEKYGETVRTIAIGGKNPFSYELCGGTHVSETGDIGMFLITSEGSISAGHRRIEAVTGRKAYELVQDRFVKLNQASNLLGSTPDNLPEKVITLLDELNTAQKLIVALRQSQVIAEFNHKLQQVKVIEDVNVLIVRLTDADADTIRQMIDRYRQQYPSRAVAVVASVTDGRPTIIAAVTEDLLNRGLNAIELVRFVAAPLGGGGGGRPTLAQAGGKDASTLDNSLEAVELWVKEHLLR